MVFSRRLVQKTHAVFNRASCPTTFCRFCAPTCYLGSLLCVMFETLKAQVCREIASTIYRPYKSLGGHKKKYRWQSMRFPRCFGFCSSGAPTFWQLVGLRRGRGLLGLLWPEAVQLGFSVKRLGGWLSFPNTRKELTTSKNSRKSKAHYGRPKTRKHPKTTTFFPFTVWSAFSRTIFFWGRQGRFACLGRTSPPGAAEVVDDDPRRPGEGPRALRAAALYGHWDWKRCKKVVSC